MNRKKIKLYILFSFAFSWTVALIMKLADVEFGSILSTIILACLYMPGPALAVFIIQKFIYKEGFRQYGWTLDKNNLKWILRTPLFYIALIFLAFGIIGSLGNTQLIPQFGSLDFSRENFDLQLKKLAGDKFDVSEANLPDIPLWIFFIIMIVQGIVSGSTISLPFMFGEEFGWRGLMLKETLKLGFLKASGFIGLVWGLWHLPIILMGHNYPNYPYIGIIMMCLLTIALSPIFAYVRIKTKSILGPCMLHGMINTSVGVFALYIANGNELYASIAGLAGVIAGIVITIFIYLLDKKFVAEYSDS